MHWRVELLGELRVVCGERIITRFESRKVAALLARLALQPNRLHGREELADLLWPESDRETGLARLRHALSSLRRTLVPAELAGAAFFSADRRHVRPRPEALSCDVREFERAVGQRDTAAARALYRGELLPGFYDDWICAERERLNALAGFLPEASALPPEPAPIPRSPAPLLPGYLTRFLGRETEWTELTALLAQRRLVTLIGPGGVGKTRLATALSHALTANFELVAFVPLAECVDPSQLADRVRAALQLPGGERSAREQLVPFLHRRPTLLVLDNLEQLVESGAARVVEELLLALPSVTCLVTSRRLLGIAGEQAYSIGPLSPDQSLALFLDRARAARPDFTVTERNRTSLHALCARLEGIPLALELAASRIRHLSLTEMQSQLDQSLRLLARPMPGGQQTARHASLHAAIEWSWRLLPVRQQEFLSQLSVFRGGWTPDAAAWICALPDALERLEALVDASLIFREETAQGHTRYQFLELLRTFAAEPLPPALGAVTRARHRLYYAENALPDDGANVVAALESACVDDDAPAAYHLFLAQASGALALLGAPRALTIGRAVLALPAPTPLARLEALAHTVSFADTSRETTIAQALAQEALAIAGADPALRALALSIQGQLAVSNYAPPESALPLLREARELAERSGAVATQATLLRRQGILLLRSQRNAEAATCFERSEQLFLSVGDRSGARYALANRAHVLAQQGDIPGAVLVYQLCLERARAEADRVHESKILLNIGSFQAELHQWPAALQTCQECLRACQAMGNVRTLAFALWNLPEPLMHLGHHTRAARLMAFAERFWQERFASFTAEDAAYRDRIWTGTGASEPDRLLGRSLSLAEALALAFTE